MQYSQVGEYFKKESNCYSQESQIKKFVIFFIYYFVNPMAVIRNNAGDKDNKEFYKRINAIEPTQSKLQNHRKKYQLSFISFVNLNSEFFYVFLLRT